MTSGTKLLLLFVALAMLSAAPIAAQDRTSISGASHKSVSSSSQHGARNHNESRRNPFMHHNAFGRGYGASVLLPYDSEYGQLEGRGTFDHAESQEAQESRSGPTIFEHNGQASSVVAENRVPPQPEVVKEEAQSEPPTVLIFRDGHQQEIANYAIAGSKLIVIGEKTERIQLSDLDLSATAKANEDRGVDFKMPSRS